MSNSNTSLNSYAKTYKGLPTKKNLKGKNAIEAVKQNGYALRYVKDQSPEICLEAVKQDGYALQYVKEQTPEICLEAVKQNGDALQYVNEDMFGDEVVSERTVDEIIAELPEDDRRIVLAALK